MEEEEKTSIDYQKEAKEIVKKELEKAGVINYMRAKLKKSVIDIIDHQKETTKQKLEFDFMTPLHRLNKPKEIVLLCQLIKEFLKFYELEYTLPIFENESNVKETVKRETLLKELKLQEPKENNKPVLLLLLLDRLNNNNDNNRNINRYDFNNYNSNYNKPVFENVNEDVNKLNNQLNPTQFGSTNKSLDMSNNNQNNNQNNDQINNQINNQNNNLNNNFNNNINNNNNSANNNLIDDENENNNKNNDVKIDNKDGNTENNGVKGTNPNENNKKVSKYNDQYQEALLDVTGGK